MYGVLAAKHDVVKSTIRGHYMTAKRYGFMDEEGLATPPAYNERRKPGHR
jgi:hypothetical protein